MGFESKSAPRGKSCPSRLLLHHFSLSLSLLSLSFRFLFFFFLLCLTWFAPQQIVNSSPVLPLPQSGLCAEQNSVCFFLCVCVFVCMCVCVMKRERERERERGESLLSARHGAQSVHQAAQAKFPRRTHKRTHTLADKRRGLLYFLRGGGGFFIYFFCPLPNHVAVLL